MALTDRTAATPLIPEEYQREIVQSIPQQSAIMQIARRLPNMSRNQLRMPVLSGLVSAYFVDGEPTTENNDDGFKQVSNAAWMNKFINAGELAVIVPVPENVLDDADYDIWGEVQPRIVEAMGQAFDAAVMYGTNAPSDWPTDIVSGATGAGHIVTEGSAGDDLYDDILGEAGVIAYVEEDGYIVNGHIGALPLRAKLRGLRDEDGQPIFHRNPVQDGVRYDLDGNDIVFPRNGGIDPAETLLVSGDWDQLVYAIRQDVTANVLTEATIYDTNGDVLYALAQQDMVALRVKMRLGWQLPNPVNRVNTNDGTRFPFAILSPAGS